MNLLQDGNLGKPVRTMLCTVEYSVEAPLPAHTNPTAGSRTAHPRPQGALPPVSLHAPLITLQLLLAGVWGAVLHLAN